MWVFLQRSGELRKGDVFVAFGYSGHGEGKGNPDLQNVPNVGPIPVGAYLIGSESEDKSHGPVALHLVPLTGTETFGRSGFLVHGDSIASPGSASHGCIVAPRPVREEMRDGRDRLLVVLSGRAPLGSV